MRLSLRFFVSSIATLAAFAPAGGQQTLDLRPERSGGQGIEVSVVASGLRVPASIAFLPDGRALVADRPLARLHALDLRTGALDTIAGLPAIAASGDSGLHDVLVDAQFATNRTIYLAYTVAGAGDTYALAVDRARLDGRRLTDVQRLFTASPYLEGGDHFGGRMVQSGEHLFITSGDRQHRDLAQGLDNHIGKVLRIRTDGGVPADNPFVGRNGARAEIWSYGHRNPQGLALHPGTGELWSHEHGPRGGDEVNRIVAGANYGWPAVSFGFEYDGGPIGAGTPQREGMEPPAHVYVPSIAPSGLAIYRGSAFPEWQGSMLIGALALRHLNRVVLGEHGLRLEERLLGGRGLRVRAVAEAPDGSVLLGVDGGTVLRLAPAATGASVGGDNFAQSDSVVHLGNMGVLIRRPGGDVLVDALFGDGLPDYEVVEPGLRAALERAAAPFDRVTLVLATHAHRDHFDATAVRRFLEHAPEAVFVGPADAAAQLSGAPELRSRVHGLERAADLPALPATRGVTVLDLPHGRTVRPVINLGYVVRVGGKRVLHAGDAELTLEQWENTAQGDVTGVELAVLPYWYVSGEATLATVRNRVQPRRTLLTHLPLGATPETANSAGVTLASLAGRLPGASLSRAGVAVTY